MEVYVDRIEGLIYSKGFSSMSKKEVAKKLNHIILTAFKEGEEKQKNRDYLKIKKLLEEI